MTRSPVVELRMGSTGAGLFVGCGVGVGFVTPVALHSIPLLGPLAASLSSSLHGLNAATGGMAGAARARLRGLGLRHLDAGCGCGVMLGYGWGAGLMLSPTAQHSIAHGLQAAGRAVTAKLPPPLQAALRQRQHGLSGPAGSEASAGFSNPQDALHAQLRNNSAGCQGSTVVTKNGGIGTTGGTHPAEQLSDGGRPTTDTAEQLAELTRLVLKQQNQLGDIKQHIEMLQAAVCNIDPTAAGCKR